MRRKTLKTLIVVMLILIFTASAVSADPPWERAKPFKGNLKVKQKFGFDDVDESLWWAQKAIQKMNMKKIINGYGKGLFKPQRHVSHLEAIIMALRVMGWEDEIDEIRTIPVEVKKVLAVGWVRAYYYITLAVEKGIIKEYELLKFKPNEPAKRWEIAKYVVRALDMEDEALDHMDEDLLFKDANSVPSRAVGYVYIVNELGIMTGAANGNFFPNKNVTRAEMAVLIDRIDEGLDNEIDENENRGWVYSFDEDDMTLTLKLSSNSKITYDVVEGVSVYKDRDFIDFNDLKIGDLVEVVLNSNGEVIFIEVKKEQPRKIIERFEGRIKAITMDEDESTVTVETYKGDDKIFKVTDDTDIEIDGRSADLEDIKIGDWAKVKVNAEDVALEIEISTEEEYEGVLAHIRLRSTERLTIRLENGDEISFGIHEDVRIRKDGKSARLSKLEVGDLIEVKVERGLIVEIKAETPEPEEFEVEGVIKQIVIGDVNKIKVEDEDDELLVFDVDEDVEVEIDGDGVSFEDLEPGYKVKIEGEGQVVYKIDAETPDEDKDDEDEDEDVIVEGTVQSITIGFVSSITIETEDEDEMTYVVSEDVEFKGDIDSLNELRRDDEVRLKIEKNVVVEIKSLE